MKINIIHQKKLRLNPDIRAICGFVSGGREAPCPNFSRKYQKYPDEVDKNIFTLVGKLREKGITCNKASVMKALHGKKIKEAKTIETFETVQPPSDGLYTDQIGVLLVSPVGDCANVISWREEGVRIAIAHVGWKGTINGIVEQLKGVMGDKEQNEALPAIITPHIRSPHFTLNSWDFLKVQEYWEGGEEEEKVLCQSQKTGKEKIYPLEKALPLLCRKHGFEVIYHSPICTYENENIFSHQRSKQHKLPEGRFACFALLSSK